MTFPAIGGPAHGQEFAGGFAAVHVHVADQPPTPTLTERAFEFVSCITHVYHRESFVRNGPDGAVKLAVYVWEGLDSAEALRLVAECF